MATWIWVNIDSDNSLPPEGIEPLPEPFWLLKVMFFCIHLRAISRRVSKLSLRMKSFKITLKLQRQCLGAADDVQSPEPVLIKL